MRDARESDLIQRICGAAHKRRYSVTTIHGTQTMEPTAQRKKKKNSSNASYPSYVLTSHDVLTKGIEYMSIPVTQRASASTRIDAFKKHYGSDPYVVAALWYDLQTTKVADARLLPSKVLKLGFESS